MINFMAKGSYTMNIYNNWMRHLIIQILIYLEMLGLNMMENLKMIAKYLLFIFFFQNELYYCISDNLFIQIFKLLLLFKK